MIGARRRPLLWLLAASIFWASEAVEAQPDSIYLQEDKPDVVLSAAIRAQAEKLGNDPVRIYEFVRNELAYQAYYGLMKGPESTLRVRAGNEYDLAALLVSLLRAANVPARFVRGRIEMSDAQAAAWTGAKDGNSACQFWRKTEPSSWLGVGSCVAFGTSPTGATRDHGLRRVQRLHIWVEAKVVLARYRGLGTGNAGRAWIALDPSFKQLDWNPDPQLLTQTPPPVEFDYTGPEGYYRRVDPRLPLEIFVDQVVDYLAAEQPERTLEEILFRGSLRRVAPGILPTALPYDVLSAPTAQRDASLVPLHQQPLTPSPLAGTNGRTDYHYRWTVFGCPGTSACPGFGLAEIEAGDFTASLAGRRVTLSFPPNAATAALVPVSGYDCSTAITTQPTIWVDGEPNPPGLIVRMSQQPVCRQMTLNLTTSMPLGDRGFLPGSALIPSLYAIRAGGTFVLALDAYTAGPELVAEAAGDLVRATSDYRIADDGIAAFVDLDRDGYKGPGERYLGQDFEAQEALVGGLLHLANVRFFDLLRGGNALGRELHHRLEVMFPGTGLITGGIRTIDLMGAPAAVISDQLVIDVKGVVGASLDRSGDGISTLEPWEELAAHQASAAEHTIWEELAAIEAVSTVKGFQVGFAQGRELLVLRDFGQASGEVAARCGSQTCTGLDRIAYCEIRRAFRLPGRAATWDANPECQQRIASQPPGRTTQELRINACANFGHLNWRGFVFYEKAQAAGATSQSFTIGPTSAGTPVCESSSQSSAMAVAGPALGGGFAATLVPANPFDPSLLLGPPPPSVLPSFFDLDPRVFVPNSLAANAVTAGDPVSVVTGNNQHTELDLQIAGRAGHDLRIVRSYNSRLKYDGPLGYGWIHTLDQHLQRFPGEDPADPNDDLVFWRTEQGNEVRFDQTADGLVPEVGVYHRLVREPDGTYTLTLKQGGVMRFASDDPEGRANLLELRDRSGNRIRAVYTGGRLSSVLDTAGRSLVFTYDGAGRLAEIRDWTGRRWLYEVDGNGDLVSFMDPEQVFREQFEPGSGRRTRYSYDSGLSDEALNHNLRCWIRAAAGRPLAAGVPDLCGPDARGHTWMHFSYAPTDSVASHTDSLGRTTTFSFNFFRRRSYVNHPDGSSERFVFDRSGNVVRHETARGTIRRFEFEPGTRNKVKEWDGDGNLTLATFDDRGDLRSRTDRLGHVETWTYDAFGQPTTHVDRRGNQRRWEYEAGRGLLLREFATVDGAETLLRRHSYDFFGNRSSTTSFAQPGQAEPRPTQFFYGHPSTSLTRLVDAEGAVTRIVPDALGRPAREERTRTTASGAVETVVTARCYDALDRVRREVDPAGTVRRAALDADGLVVNRATLPASEIPGDPCGAVPPGEIDEWRFYDAFGRLVESQDALGNATRFGYDARDRLTERVLPSGSTERLALDGVGNVTAMTNASDRTVRFEYDAEERLVRLVDPLGREVRMEYDAEGREIRRWGPTAKTVSTPDEIRLVFEALEIDAVGNVLRFRNAAGHEMQQEFDELRRLRAREGPVGLPESARTEFRYDLLGAQIAKIDGEGDFTQIEYDRVGRVVRQTDALARSATFEYDELGDLVATTDAAGLRMELEYDARGLLLRRSGPGVDDRYTYDARGRLATATNAVSSHRFAYDARDRMIEHYGSLMGTARMVYDEDGREKQLVYPMPPGGGLTKSPVTTFQYDPAGRVTSIHDTGTFSAPGQERMWSWGFVWDGAGRLADRLDPRGVRAATTYRPEGWVDAIALSYPGLADETVDYNNYDPLGNPLRIDFPEGITRPVFDGRSRVKGATHQVANEEFDYDRDGNRTRHKMGFNRRFVVDAADELEETRRVSDDVLEEGFVYDPAGRRIVRFEVQTGVATGYAYDGLGRLTAVADTTGYELTLEYDPLGNRIRRTETLPGAASETTLFLSGLVELRGVDAQGQAAETVRWIPGPGPGGVVAEVSAGPSAQAPVLWSLLGDAAGNVVRMARVDAAPGGALATTRASVRYAAFGEQIQSSGSAPTERRFAGMLSEGASGLVHMGARHYDPRLGAFLQPDPLGIAAVATYAYAANNPYRFVDPSGLDPFSIAGDFGFSFPAGGSGFGGSTSSSFASTSTGGGGSQSGGGRDFFTAGALVGGTAVDGRSGVDAAVFLGVTVGRSDSGNFGVTKTSAGFSLTSEFGDLQRPGGGRNSPVAGAELDADALPFFIRGGPEALFAPDLHTIDVSLFVVTIKVFTGPDFNEFRGIAGVFGPGVGFSIVRGGFTPIFVRDSPLE